jgi:glutamate racemase
VDRLPAYDYLYLGDNGRTPYGTRSFETVYRYTLECVKWMLQQNCPLVILACNTASAKALRSIQQNDLKKLSLTARLLGVIRPTTEVIGNYTVSNQIGDILPGKLESMKVEVRYEVRKSERTKLEVRKPLSKIIIIARQKNESFLVTLAKTGFRAVSARRGVRVGELSQ